MNTEYIKNIAAEVDAWFEEDGHSYSRQAWNEKCAELIVTRCAAIVSLYRRDNMEDKAVADTLEMAYKEIKLSFGLKP